MTKKNNRTWCVLSAPKDEAADSITEWGVAVDNLTSKAEAEKAAKDFLKEHGSDFCVRLVQYGPVVSAKVVSRVSLVGEF